MKKYQYLASWDDQTLTRVGEPVVVLGDSNVSQVEVVLPSNFLLDPTKAECRMYFMLPGKKESNHDVLETAVKDDNGDSHVTWTIKHVHSKKGGRLAFSLTLIGDDAQWDSRTAIIPVYESRYQPESEEAEEPYTGRLTALEGSMASIRGEFAEVQDDFEKLKETATLGTPIPESLVANMQEGHVYIYTGMEPGYTAGHVYYYVDGVLKDGGVYGGTAVDATLTQSGQAADAAAVGAEVSAIKEDLSDLNSTLVASFDTNDKSGGGVDFTYVPADGSFNVTTETFVTNRNSAWKNLLVGARNLYGMVPGEKYYCEIEKSGEGAETVQVWWKFYRDGSQSGNSHALYDSGFITIDEWAGGIVLRLAASTDGVALNCSIKIRLERAMSNRALQSTVSVMDGKLAGIQPNLNILTLGDSIALGARNGNRGFVGDLGMQYVNIAVSGASISTVRTQYTNVFTQLLNYKSANPTYKPDCIVANGGINDYISGAQMGAIPTVPAMSDTEAEALDKATLMGATGYLFYQMVKLYPRAQRYFVIVHKIKRGENNIYYPTHVNPAGGYTQDEMHDALVAICNVYGVKVIDVYKDSMLNTAFSQYVSPTAYSADQSVTDLYFTDTDGLHPLALGYREAYVPLVKLALMGATKK